MLLNATVIVAALGYFVDVFDILLFSILRVPSLKDLGLSDAEVLERGIQILNLQLRGLVSGGIIWGIIGDKYGRVSVLFGSILIYSLANIGCAFVHSVEAYALLRLLAGFGLAGELGAGITLVAELLPKEKRGWGTTVVTGVGVAGAIVAGIIGELLPWRICYLIGGVLGLLLLLARMKVAESHAFQNLKLNHEVSRGSLAMLFRSGDRALRYLLCVLLGFPVMYVVYVFVTFSPELGRSLGMVSPVSAALCVVYCYVGITLGDFFFGALSQISRSRKLPGFFSCTTLAIGLGIAYLYPPASPFQFYLYALGLGLCSANWAVLVTTTAEQFGTNLRSTVTTSVPNMIRGSAILLTFSFREMKSVFSPYESAIAVGFASVAIALFALRSLRETFARDLDFIEE